MSTVPQRVAVIVPTLNEVAMIGAVLQGILQTGLVSWVIVVDDSSTDNTVDVVQSIQKIDPRIRLIVRRNLGKSFARSYVAGFRCALDLGATALIQMDGDGSHNPADIPRIVDALGTFDVVVCSRYAAGGKNCMRSLRRLALSYLGSRFSRALLGMPIRDMTSGFNGWTAGILEGCALEDSKLEGFGFQIWLKWRAYESRASMTELPIVFQDRESGISKFRLSMATEVFFGILRMRSEASGLRSSSLRSTFPNPQFRR